MARNRAVNVVIKGDYDNSDIQRAIKELNKLGGTVDTQHSKMLSFGKVAAVAAAAGLAVAAKETYDFAKASVTAAQESQVADDRLKQIAKSMGLVKGEYAGGVQRLNEYSSALMKQIGVDDESIKAVQAKLLTFKSLGKTINETGGAMDRATKAAFDLAAAGFGSAETNATQLGKALQDPVKGLTALARSGVTFTEGEKEKIKALVASGKAAEAQDMVLKAIEKQVGNTAAATATSAEKMKVSFGELQESVGTALLPTLNTFADALVPIFDGLQKPLTDIAKAVAESLGGALKAIMPILPTLATSLGQVAGVIGQALVTAIQALTPIITPLLGIMADLGTRIGPILTPILTKIGELLGKLMAAVMPLLQPLMDLVFGILEAAMPILDIVGDLLGILIDAIAPLLGIVGQLLAPLGQLVNVLFKAIEPILRPLLPLVTALASLFGDILARAIGVIVTALGGLIFAASKVAPFLLDNLVKPVVANFITFAENIVGSAEAAFGWVPGLGDKLRTAKDALGTFKTTATAAISQAADSIAKEGAKIGGGLIEQGVALVKDPSQIAKVKQAGMGVGGALTDGMALGIQNGQIPVQAAAAATIDGAERAARAAAQSNSPSKLFAEIGKDLNAGIVEGVNSSGEDVRKTLQEKYTAWFKDTVDKLKSKLEDARSAFNDFRDSVSSAIKGAFSFGDALSGAKDRAKAISDATTAYNEAAAKAAAPDATDADKKALVNAASDLKFAQDQGAALGTNFMDALKAKAAEAIGFAAKVKELIAAGLSKEALQQVLAAGVTAGTEIANQLIAGGSTTIQQTNQLVSDTQAAADEVGTLAATNWYGAGVTSAQQTLAGFREQFGKGGPGRDRINKIMDSLAAEAERNVRINVDVVQRVTQVVTSVLGAAPQARAVGGPVTGGAPYIVGEKGPELFIPDVSGTIVPNNALGSGGSTAGGNTYNVTVQTGVGDPRMIGQQVVEYIKRFEAASGPVFAAA